MISDHYYYHNLENKKQIIYKKIYDGLVAFEENIIVDGSDCLVDELKEIFWAVINDNPYFYYINPSIINFSYNSMGMVNFVPAYIFTEQESENLKKDVEKYATAILKRAQVEGASEEVIVKNIHDLLAVNVKYDFKGLQADPDSMDGMYAHSILGVLLKRAAVCDGISRVFKYLLNAVGIRCIVVMGDATSEFMYGDADGHAWNIVKINGENYHIDLTWDIAGTEGAEAVSYNYFCLNDEQILKDHVFEGNYPICCSLKENYFSKYGLAYSDLRQILNSIDKQVLSVPARIYGRIDFEGIYGDILTQIENDAMNIALNKFGQAEITTALNDKQRIFDIRVR